MGKKRKLQAAILLTLIASGIMLSLLIAMHSSPYELTRTRNSFLAQIGSDEDFTWAPSNPPNDFLWEDPSFAPTEFAYSALMGLEDSIDLPESKWGISLGIARHMGQGPGRGDGIRTNTKDAYRTIMTETRGYCSDYTQVFNGIAIASSIPVKEWGMSFDGYGGYGHAFNEVYDWDLGKWIFIDTFNSFYVTDQLNGIPLSVLEFRERMLTGQKNEILIEVIDPDRFGFKDHEQALAYYQRGADQFFLYFGNNVFSYDSHPIVRKFGAWSRALEQSIAIIAGIQPKIRILQSTSNGEHIDALFRRRNLFVTGVVLLFSLGVGFLLELRAYRRIVQAEG